MNDSTRRLAELQGAYNRLAGLLGDATYRRGQCDAQIEAARCDMDKINIEAAQLRQAEAERAERDAIMAHRHDAPTAQPLTSVPAE